MKMIVDSLTNAFNHIVLSNFSQLKLHSQVLYIRLRVTLIFFSLRTFRFLKIFSTIFFFAKRKRESEYFQKSLQIT